MGLGVYLIAAVMAGGFLPGASATASSDQAPTPVPPSLVPTIAPKPGVFSETGPMIAGRSADSATLLADGRVLMAGGLVAAEGSLSSAELYDVHAGSFRNTGGMKVSRTGHTATLLADGRVSSPEARLWGSAPKAASHISPRPSCMTPRPARLLRRAR